MIFVVVVVIIIIIIIIKWIQNLKSVKIFCFFNLHSVFQS